MPETSLTIDQVIALLKEMKGGNEAFAGTMNYDTEQDMWNDLDTRVKSIGGGGLPRPN